MKMRHKRRAADARRHARAWQLSQTQRFAALFRRVAKQTHEVLEARTFRIAAEMERQIFWEGSGPNARGGLMGLLKG